MKLFLTSDFKHPQAIEDIREYIGGNYTSQKIGYIPTAANGKGYGSWKGRDTFKLLQSLSKQLTVIELENYFFDDPISKLKDQDLIVIQGGMAAYLLYFMRVSGLEQELPEILKNTIYIGSSAGAMITSKTQKASAFFIDEPEIGADLVPGLGLINFEIYPHFQEEQYAQIESLWTKGDLYLIKDGESIIVEDDNISFTANKLLIRK